MDKSGIYKIQSISFPNRVYIGSASSLKTRKAVHFNRLRNNNHHSHKLQRHFNKYGQKDLVFLIIEICGKEKLLQREQHYIDLFNPFFNICKIAGNTLNQKLSQATKDKISMAHKGRKRKPRSNETKRKISEANKGKIFSNETIEKMRIVQRGNKNSLGHRHTEETRKKISEARKGKPGHKHTEEFKKRMSKLSKGRKLSNEAKAKISQANMGNKYCLGRIVSEESKEKNRQSHLKKLA